jgi:hypothetical protein
MCPDCITRYEDWRAAHRAEVEAAIEKAARRCVMDPTGPPAYDWRPYLPDRLRNGGEGVPDDCRHARA